jgi:SulP family sulfate permease
MRGAALLVALLVPSHALHRLAPLGPRTLSGRPAIANFPRAAQVQLDEGAAKPPSSGLGGLVKARLPIVEWLPRAVSKTAVNDIIAGLTVATMLIPQGMSYATLAGLNPIIGLYCYVPLVVYAAMGTSSFISVGPVALVSTTLMGMIAAVQGPARLALASTLMFWCGALATTIGLLGLGKIVEVVPKDVLSAFTTGAAFNIMFTQLGSLFQISVATSHAPIIMLRNAIIALPTLKWFTACLSAAAISLLLAMKKLPLHKWLKLGDNVPKSIFGDLGPFTTMVLFTIVNAVFGLTGLHGIAEVGVVPSGLPSFTSPLGHSLEGHYKDILVLTFVMLTETLAMGKALAARAGQTIQNSQEFMAMGCANMAGSFFQSYTCAGSFSRSAVVVSTGGQSQLAGIVTASSVVATLLFLTPFFTHVPKAVLAACLIIAVSGLIDTKRIGELWKASKGRFGMYLFYVGTMLAFGAAEGLMFSVAAYYAIELFKKVAKAVGIKVPSSGTQ